MCDDCPKTLEAADQSLKSECSDEVGVEETVSTCARSSVEDEVQPTLELRCEHHFAPGEQTLRASYRCEHLAEDALVLTVNDADGTLVYREQIDGPADGDHPLGWRGRGNQGAYDGELITPLNSPYTMEVQATSAGLSDTKDFHVLYHSVILRLGDYGALPDKNGNDTEKKKWAQYTLNVLGYFAGPVDGVIGDQSQRALCRYAYESPRFGERDGEGVDFYKNGTLRAALEAGECARALLAPGGLPAVGHTARLYVDHNYYYYLLDHFTSDHGHVTLDREKLDRVHLPLEVSVALMSQDDDDGTGAGIDSAAALPAIGEVDIEWFADEVPEDTAGLPAPHRRVPDPGAGLHRSGPGLHR